MARSSVQCQYRGVSATLGSGSSFTGSISGDLTASGNPVALDIFQYINGRLSIGFTGDLSDAWETAGTTTLSANGRTLILPPASPPDRNDPYVWPSGTAGVAAFFSAFSRFRTQVTVTIDDQILSTVDIEGQASSGLHDEAGTVEAAVTVAVSGEAVSGLPTSESTCLLYTSPSPRDS